MVIYHIKTLIFSVPFLGELLLTMLGAVVSFFTGWIIKVYWEASKAQIKQKKSLLHYLWIADALSVLLFVLLLTIYIWPYVDISIIPITTPVEVGSNVQIEIEATPESQCGVTIYDESTNKIIAQLEKKTVDKTGEIHWIWNMKMRTPPGSVRVVAKASAQNLKKTAEQSISIIECKEGNWFVVAASNPDRETVQQIAESLRNEKELSAEIANSSDFKKLQPGYYIAVVGKFRSQIKAKQLRDELIADNVDVYIKNSGGRK